ncbi:hypothetical protein [Blastochloris viridis]|uniref:Uncharacterized protein n=1 Tax=Blastochloris viridis TaxID=1079 RepID=A0A182D0B2_BLAVI|nr:hypothetical protein [Blastochloris viridis]BAR98798.1 hypothetical protein BV133_1205 [Blastochloris viridis]
MTAAGLDRANAGGPLEMELERTGRLSPPALAEVSGTGADRSPGSAELAAELLKVKVRFGSRNPLELWCECFPAVSPAQHKTIAARCVTSKS